ncbi:MAG: ATP-dependent helicase HrpB [Bacteroides sp.]|nr:ATP-dependent helicase HrpB [Prevotella sp.]MCM1408826.1 ATP-dependent helicase HrpB [Treponema brennaborense]MCM1470606.1 ATP-dependent helicase HrpB [Bacteroides sp.]
MNDTLHAAEKTYPDELRSLPIFPHLDTICTKLAHSPNRTLILTAETAAGKSTAVPIALLKHFSGKIIMLEPRKIAALAASARTAALLKEETGMTAGYRIRFESKISAQTRLETVTEAVLVKMMQENPFLDEISVIVIDEFHERSVYADMALAFLKEILPMRDNLFVLIMSATIHTERISEFLGAPIYAVPGRTFPVTIIYKPQENADSHTKISETAARAVLQELAETSEESGGAKNNSRTDGSILVFLPGIADIRETARILAGEAMLPPADADVFILHSSVSFSEQQKILSPPKKNSRRRVILSSSIAETSITIPDIVCVIDSGLSRISRFDARTGMQKLVTETESEFSAAQRSGRAGRTQPGKCIRLWQKSEPRIRDFPPEITRTDLLPIVLECALWGARRAADLQWLDPPKNTAWESARTLLEYMNCIEKTGAVTERGKAVLQLGIHPRAALMLIETAVTFRHIPQKIIDAAGQISAAADNPAEKEKFTAAITRRLKKIQFPKNNNTEKNYEQAKLSNNHNPPPHIFSSALLAGFPDRIARHTEHGCYQFPSGRFAALPRNKQNGANFFPPWIIATNADAGERSGTIFQYEIPDEQTIELWISSRLRSEISAEFKTNETAKVRKTKRFYYGKLLIKEIKMEADSADIARAWHDAVKKKGFSALPSFAETEHFLLRAQFYYQHKNNDSNNANAAPDFRENPANPENLCSTLEEWFFPFIPANGIVSAKTVYDALFFKLDGAAVDKKVPRYFQLPSGKKRPLAYEIFKKSSDHQNPEIIPVLEIIIQEIFGCKETPRILGIPVLFRLLSPARRPLQTTQDIAAFWQTAWPQICKEMKGRYPKHNWNPDKPE